MGPEIVIDNKRVLVTRYVVRTVKLRSEYYECIDDPRDFVDKLKDAGVKGDLFTFLQEIGDTDPKHSFRLEWDSLAVLPVSTYENWWKKQINDKTRNMVRKAHKAGVELQTMEFNDDLIRRIKDVYDESPLRQGKRFTHYGKDLDTLRREHSSFLERSDFIGAFYGDELIGFIKLVHGRNASSLLQIVSKLAHRDKAPTNALIAKAVEICAQRNTRYLHYGVWSKRGLGDFKHHHGFERMSIPRYFIPMTVTGKVILRLNCHHKPTYYLPDNWKEKWVALRGRWSLWRYRGYGYCKSNGR